MKYQRTVPKHVFTVGPVEWRFNREILKDGQPFMRIEDLGSFTEKEIDETAKRICEWFNNHENNQVA